MKNMDRETIEKAALEHALNTTGLDYIGEVECENGFIAGAEWRINAAWHTDLKEAQTQRKVLVEFADALISELKKETKDETDTDH